MSTLTAPVAPRRVPSEVNKASLVSEVVKRTDVARSEASRVVDAVIQVIREQVGRGQRVVLSGFGTFERVRRNPRTGRNPRTREAVRIPARNAPVFKPGAAFRASVAAPRRRKQAGKRPSRKAAGRR
jgi:DNA-binding protein HU-beta